MVDNKDKSHPDIYYKAMALIGHSNPKDYCVFDDALGAIKTANSIGMFTVGIQDPVAKNKTNQMPLICDMYLADFNLLLK